LKQTPTLDSFKKSTNIKNFPKVSIILPARNEEKYIARCLDSLLRQDYTNFEIIAINDSSTDRTEAIMQHYAVRDPRILIVDAKPKPGGWVGKNWACYQGYLRATGNLLLQSFYAKTFGQKSHYRCFQLFYIVDFPLFV
jgi:glycosyltransferase involved in cell wall biosynthesis